MYLVLGAATALKLLCWAVCAALQAKSDSMLALAEVRAVTRARARRGRCTAGVHCALRACAGVCAHASASSRQRRRAARGVASSMLTASLHRVAPHTPQQDHLNDIMSNLVAIVTAVLAGLVNGGWWIDPAGTYLALRPLGLQQQAAAAAAIQPTSAPAPSCQKAPCSTCSLLLCD